MDTVLVALVSLSFSDLVQPCGQGREEEPPDSQLQKWVLCLLPCHSDHPKESRPKSLTACHSPAKGIDSKNGHLIRFRSMS